MAFTHDDVKRISDSIINNIEKDWYSEDELKDFFAQINRITNYILSGKQIDFDFDIDTQIKIKSFCNLLSKSDELDTSDILLLRIFKKTYVDTDFLSAALENHQSPALFRKKIDQIRNLGYSYFNIIEQLPDSIVFSDSPVHDEFVKFMLDLVPKHYDEVIEVENCLKEDFGAQLIRIYASSTDLNLMPLLVCTVFYERKISSILLRTLAYYGHQRHKKQLLEFVLNPKTEIEEIDRFLTLQILKSFYPDEITPILIAMLRDCLKRMFETSFLNNLGCTLLPFEEGFETEKNTTLFLRTIDIAEQYLSTEILEIYSDIFLKEKCTYLHEYELNKLLSVYLKHDYSPYFDVIWNTSKDKTRFIQNEISTFIAKIGNSVLPKIEESLQDASPSVRQCMALALAKMKTPEAKAILENTIHSETNDDARDIMLRVVSNNYKNMSDEELNDLIKKASERGKLKKPVSQWVDVETLPELKDKNGKVVDKGWIKFLLYRMTRTSDICTEVEARLVIDRIDRESAGEFSNELYKRFMDNGGEAKYKYILTIVGLFADDKWADKIEKDIPKWVEAKRGKMAEYGVKALALQGSNNALRAVEYFSRKFQNRYSNVGIAASQALNVAAEELNMNINDLADSIVPDFGFENMYRSFEVDGEEYRAFVGKDFKLQYLNEEGKIRKSPPKGIDKELLTEFKGLSKEIRDVVKTQSSRMELYLVIQRKWDVEKWRNFFLQKPVMLVYASRLLWGEYDADNQLIKTFYVSEIGELMNIEDEEIELDKTSKISMIHPLLISEAEKEAWQRKFFEMEIEPIFPQLKRDVESIPESMKNENSVTRFDGIKINTYRLKSFMRRNGWYNGEIIDGGGITSISKPYETFKLDAILETDGEFFVGYDESDFETELRTLLFMPYGKSDAKDALNLSEVPPIVYSEVISELKQLMPEEKKISE